MTPLVVFLSGLSPQALPAVFLRSTQFRRRRARALGLAYSRSSSLWRFTRYRSRRRLAADRADGVAGAMIAAPSPPVDL